MREPEAGTRHAGYLNRRSVPRLTVGACSEHSRLWQAAAKDLGYFLIALRKIRIAICRTSKRRYWCACSRSRCFISSY